MINTYIWLAFYFREDPADFDVDVAVVDGVP
jgi:hypothetical protein